MDLQVQTNNARIINIQVDKYPDECPLCHHGIEPKFLYGYLDTKNFFASLGFYCPKLNCNGFFVGAYQGALGTRFSLLRTLLGENKQKDFSEAITQISNDFVEIYHQASSAEENGLNEICGVGYRKALEFLIKDYIIYKDNGLKETVEKLLLGKCINDHIKNENIKAVAKRAVWLGNDETHYIRKWIMKDINDLKLLIDLTVHWIETEDLTEKMISSMPE